MASASAISLALWGLLFWPCARGSQRGSRESRSASAIGTAVVIVDAHLAALVKAIVFVVARDTFAKDAMNRRVVWHPFRARPSPNRDCAPSCFRCGHGSCVQHPVFCTARYPSEEHTPVVVNPTVP